MNVPHNIVLHDVLPEVKAKDLKYAPYNLSIDVTEFSETISGNFFKTLRAFQSIGVDLASDVEIESFKDFIASTVDKRNKIVHHNDRALDLSLPDILRTLEQFSLYCTALVRVVSASAHLT